MTGDDFKFWVIGILVYPFAMVATVAGTIYAILAESFQEGAAWWRQ